MGRLFTLTDTIKDTIKDALDDLITELGKNCLLVYPPKKVMCNTCIYSPTLQRSSNISVSGTPFANGICPECHGAGTVEEETSETIQLLCSFNPTNSEIRIDYNFPMENLRSPDAVIKTKGYISDAHKMKKAQYLIYNSDARPILNHRYYLLSDPTDTSNIIQGRYFSCLWARKGTGAAI